MVKTKELKVAIDAVVKAGNYLKAVHGKRQSFAYKKTSNRLSKDTRKGFQSKGDVKAEAIILKILKQEFPNYGLLSEESKPYEINKDYLWVVDPLEGTIAYIHGTENYGVALSLLYKKTIILGVVYCPALSYLFWAATEKGSFLNGQQIKVSPTNEIDDCLISIEHKMFRFIDKYPKIINQLIKKIRRLRVGESCGQELSYVAAGKTDALIKAKQPLYDYAAGKIILEEAGGKFTDFKGKKTTIILDPEIGINFVASNGKIHQELLKYFKQ